MSEQHLYLMLKPHRTTALAIDALRCALGLDQKYPADRFHITLMFLKGFHATSAVDLARLRRALEPLRASPFDVSFNRLRGNALVGSDSGALRAFRRQLLGQLAASGIVLPRHGFAPHLSLVYGDRLNRNIPTTPIGWRVDELLLINSIHGEGHEVKGRWPLVSAQRSFAF